MSTPSTPITRSLLVRNHHKKSELNGSKFSSSETMSSEFLSKFVDWRNSSFKALPENRKCDRWYQALLNNGVWQQWFLDGLVQSEDISRSTLARIYGKLNPAKPNTGSPIRSSARVTGAQFCMRRAVVVQCTLPPIVASRLRGARGRRRRRLRAPPPPPRALRRRARARGRRPRRWPPLC